MGNKLELLNADGLDEGFSHFTSYSDGDMNEAMWDSYNVTKPPYRYAVKQNQGDGVTYEVMSNFDENNLDLPTVNNK